MLVLSRHVGESVVIGSNITVFVTEISGGRVKLGFEAPPDVKIDRAEVRQRQLTEGQRKTLGGLRLVRENGISRAADKAA